MINETRKLARFEEVLAVAPIDGADAIEKIQIGGWWVVSKKNEHKVGDTVVYFEIDSTLPCIPEFEFLRKSSYKKADFLVLGEGYRLKTIRLRKQISQGLVISLGTLIRVCDELQVLPPFNLQFGMDLTELLKIQKWDPPLNTQISGLAKGTFPSWMQKTDQERIQNLKRDLYDWKNKSLTFEVTEKLEGSSMTCYLKDGVFGVCSRNIDLKEDGGDSFWAAAKKQHIEESMRKSFGSGNVAIQGELIGPGIQGNIYGMTETKFMAFDIFMIDSFTYMEPKNRRVFLVMLGIPTVPILSVNELITDMDQIIAGANGTSQLGGTLREGYVWKCNENPEISFKAISDLYLMKVKDE